MFKVNNKNIRTTPGRVGSLTESEPINFNLKKYTINPLMPGVHKRSPPGIKGLIGVFSSLRNKMKFPIIDFFSKCDQIRRKLLIWSHCLKKSFMENFFFVHWLPQLHLKTVIGGVLSKKLFLKSSQYSQENTCVEIAF